MWTWSEVEALSIHARRSVRPCSGPRSGVTDAVVLMLVFKQKVLPPSRLHCSCQSATVSVSGVSPQPLPRR